MSEKRVTQSLLLPDLRYVKETFTNKTRVIECIKVSEFEVCPHCATKTSSIYDHRITSPRDEHIRDKLVQLVIKKRRFRCVNAECRRVFTEPVAGIMKRYRTTQRFRAYIRKCASRYMSLKEVRTHVKCSNSTVYKAFYQQIDLELRKTQNPWPKTCQPPKYGQNS